MSNSVRYYALRPGSFKLDGGAMFGIIPRPMWQKVAAPDEQNRIELALRLLLIKTPNKLILMDTGIGDYHDEKFVDRFAVRTENSCLEKAIEHAGFHVDQLTDLVISHLHFDHVGGIGKKTGDDMLPVFPNATVHLHQKHFEYAQSPSERDAGSFIKKDFMPVIEIYTKNKKIHWVTGEQGIILKDNQYQLNFLMSSGHTPHLMHAYDDKVIYLADIIPMSHHVPIPWVMAYDMQPGISTQDKKRILNMIAQNKLFVFYEHDPDFWGSKIVVDTKGNFKTEMLGNCNKTLSLEITL
jgi:glyoxylase-like metal-dependent hydrolase (beta-lactamase superfamily II)